MVDLHISSSDTRRLPLTHIHAGSDGFMIDYNHKFSIHFILDQSHLVQWNNWWDPVVHVVKRAIKKLHNRRGGEQQNHYSTFLSMLLALKPPLHSSRMRTGFVPHSIRADFYKSLIFRTGSAWKSNTYHCWLGSPNGFRGQIFPGGINLESLGSQWKGRTTVQVHGPVGQPNHRIWRLYVPNSERVNWIMIRSIWRRLYPRIETQRKNSAWRHQRLFLACNQCSIHRHVARGLACCRLEQYA